MRHGFSRPLAALVLAACATSAWADPAPAPLHAHHRRAHHWRMVASAPAPRMPARPPAPTAAPAVGPAPVPNQAVAPPGATPPSDVSAQPQVFQLHYPPQGDGYVTGSSPQAMDDRNAAKATGVEVKVPLDQ